ncbi:hypothetical protein QOZ80_4BG0334910 [Eleusine coracana subsp. coracana]|nr:hypothetical protein QOZ80_4BG0334910 [Eleusine coracana subsp. coracana]
MAKEEELKRIDLKVNVSCCEGCRRKVMKAMSLKGVLRTELKPSHDRVTVVGDVDAKLLVKKLSKVGKIAEVLLTPSTCEDGAKKRDDGGKNQDAGDKLASALAEEKSRGKEGDGKATTGDDKPAAACKPECKKCASHGAARDDSKNAKEKTPPSKGDAAAARSAAEEGNDGFVAKFSSTPDHSVVQQFHHYHRAEPAMVVPVHVPPYYPPPTYYAAPPPPPVMMMMGVPRRGPQLRGSRFDADYFNDDNAVGCSVM